MWSIGLYKEMNQHLILTYLLRNTDLSNLQTLLELRGLHIHVDQKSRKPFYKNSFVHEQELEGSVMCANTDAQHGADKSRTWRFRIPLRNSTGIRGLTHSRRLVVAVGFRAVATVLI